VKSSLQVVSVITLRNWGCLGLFTLLACATALAQTSFDVRSAESPDQSRSPERIVNERLSVWQQRMKLEDWHISVVMMRHSELKPKTLGNIRWDKGKKSAVIWVQDAADYKLPFDKMLEDMEFTIVHELVHLELASLPKSEASRSSEEHAVNRIAEALLKMDRQRQ
jgi:hypothetical protein